MDPHRVQQLYDEHLAAETALDIEPLMATLCADPVYEFFPIAKVLRGRANITALYRDHFPNFLPRVAGFETVNSWVNELAAGHEDDIDLLDPDRPAGPPSRHRVVSLMPVDEPSGLLAGERIYADEVFLRALLGPWFARLEPMHDR